MSQHEDKNNIEEEKLPSKRSIKAIEKAKKRRKKKKDPNAPKRPLGPYFFYFKENNTKIKEENPDFIQKSVVALIAKNWGELTEEQKAPYVEKSREDKLRYVREKAEYDKQQKLEEEKEVANPRKRQRSKLESESRHRNGHKRPKHDSIYPIIEEKEVRLRDLLGSEQADFPSDSEELAAWSPPSISSSEVRISKVREMPEIK